MTHDDLRPDYLLYAMGALPDPELSELRAHLERGCETCTLGLRDAGVLAFGIGADLDGPEPPRRLRKRVLAAVDREAKSGNWFAAWVVTASAAVLALALTTGLYLVQRHRSGEQLAELRSELASNRAQTMALHEALALIGAPQTHEVNFGQGKPSGPPRGRVFFQPSAILLLATNLAPPPPGKTYEMWIIRGGKPVPAGLFASDPQGNAIHLYRTVNPPTASDTVAVTLEISAGVTVPTSTPVIVAPLTS